MRTYMAPSAPCTAEPVKFDEILTRLRSLVERLEGGNLPLEEGLACFEEGMQLCGRGAELLDQAEKRVEILLATAGDGGPRTAPLDPAQDPEDKE
jgi:exodeoxyribonuclease VII small subunit